MAATVLIVDDEPQLLKLMVRIFERSGYQVLAAADGDRAIELVTQRGDAIDVMVLDVIIPPKGAGAVLDAVLPDHPDLHLVMASGDQLADELREKLDGQGGVFVRKPFVPKAILQVVDRMLQGGKFEAG